MESIFFCGGEEEQTINRRKIFGEGKYVFCGVEENRRRKKRKIVGEGEYLFLVEE